MKKTIFFIFTIVAVSMILSLTACSNNKSPATKYISMMEELIEPNINSWKYDLEPTLELEMRLGIQWDEIEGFIKENQDYKLKEKDRKALKSFMMDTNKKLGERLSHVAAGEIDEALKQCKSLGEIAEFIERRMFSFL